MPITKDDPTVLRLEGLGVMPYSARGLQQSLAPIDIASQLERSINGELVDLGYDPMKKYKSTITGSDQRPPVCDGLWPGKIVTVECIAKLVMPEYAAPQRPPVDYDSMIHEQGWVMYRPRLIMCVMNWSMEEEEWTAGVTWSMELEEF